MCLGWVLRNWRKHEGRPASQKRSHCLLCETRLLQLNRKSSRYGHIWSHLIRWLTSRFTYCSLYGQDPETADIYMVFDLEIMQSSRRRIFAFQQLKEYFVKSILMARVHGTMKDDRIVLRLEHSVYSEAPEVHIFYCVCTAEDKRNKQCVSFFLLSRHILFLRILYLSNPSWILVTFRTRPLPNRFTNTQPNILNLDNILYC